MTIVIRQAEVKDHQIRLASRTIAQAVMGGGGFDDVEAVIGQRGAQEAADRQLVLDQDHLGGRGHGDFPSGALPCSRCSGGAA